MDALKAGDVAPNFDLASDDGQEVKLRDYRGRNVVLYFFPKALTPG
jgi:thioredoxin-dependent peroxiredoxin